MPSIQLEKKVPEGFLERLACNVFRAAAFNGPCYYQKNDTEVMLGFTPVHIIKAQGESRLEKIQKYTGEISGDYTVPWLGGVSFAPVAHNNTAAWGGFPNTSFFLPKYFFTQKEQILTFTFSSQHDIQIEEVGSEYNKVLRLVVRGLVERPMPTCDLLIQPQKPSEEWLSLCSELDKKILAGDLQKIVPSQIAHGRLSHFEAGAVVEKLNALPGDRLHKFAYRFDRDLFLGASPELLFEQEHRELFVPAIAGTRVRNLQDAAADMQIGEELKLSSKEQREHRHVVDFIRMRLAQLGANLPAEQEPELLRLPTLWHLFTPHHVQLDQVHPLEVLTALHPTPAVSGLPQEAATNILVEKEALSRGLFASPVGYFYANQRRARFIVGIRSVLLQDNNQPEAYFFAGAGYVRGSDAAAEWRESSEKMRIMRQLFDT